MSEPNDREPNRSSAPPPIPEALLKPVDHPRADEILHPRRDTHDQRDAASQAKGWAIAMSFAFTVMAGGLLGWAVQQWIWPAAKPWPLLVGLFAALIGGFVRFIREGLAAANRD